MAIALYGTKVGMTRIFHEDQAVPVTVIQVLPNEVVEVKTDEKHGYQALKVAFGPRKRQPTKALAGEYKKADVAPRRFLREIPVIDGVATGGKVTVTALDAGKLVDVSGIIKGRGFAGVMKRHGFSGLKASHGTHRVHRAPGAIGACATPSRVFKGMRMAGQYGNERVTVLNLQVVQSDPGRNLLLVRGAVPGPEGGLVMVRSAVKAPARKGA